MRALIRRLIPAGGRARIFEFYVRRIRPLLLTGRSVYCPCCDRHFRRFLRSRPGGRSGALCPGCGSFERHRLLWLLLGERRDLLDADRTLVHFAPAPVIRRKLASRSRLRYVCADLDPDKATVRTDITRTAFRTNRVDWIVCSHVLEHIEDDDAAMAEMLRILRPGGFAMIAVPFDRRDETLEDPSIIDPAERRRLYWDADHVRLYGWDIQDRLDRAGFEVEIHEFVRGYPPEKRAYYGLQDDPVFVARKTSASRSASRRRS